MERSLSAAQRNTPVIESHQSRCARHRRTGGEELECSTANTPVIESRESGCARHRRTGGEELECSTANTPVRRDTLSSSSVDEVQYPGLEESMLKSSYFSLSHISSTCHLLLGASDPVEAKTINGAPRSWTRIHGFDRSPGTTLPAGHCSCRFWRDFPFSSRSGQLTRSSHFPWLLTARGGGGGYLIATFASLFGRLAFDCPRRGGGVIDRRLLGSIFGPIFRAPKRGGGG